MRAEIATIGESDERSETDQEGRRKVRRNDAGDGGVATTFFAGTDLVKCGLAEAVGSLTQFLVLFKSPMTLPELYPEHDLFAQLMTLKNTLRTIRGEDLIAHLGLDYYE